MSESLSPEPVWLPFRDDVSALHGRHLVVLRHGHEELGEIQVREPDNGLCLVMFVAPMPDEGERRTVLAGLPAVSAPVSDRGARVRFLTSEGFERLRDHEDSSQATLELDLRHESGHAALNHWAMNDPTFNEAERIVSRDMPG